MLMSGPEATLGVSPWMSAAMPPSAFETSAIAEILTQTVLVRPAARRSAPRLAYAGVVPGNSLSEPEVFVLADQALNKVVARIGDDQWSMEMPASFQTRRSDRRPTLRQIINYHAYDDAWVPDMLAGRTMDEAGKDNHKGDLLGDDPKARFAEIVEKACAAARNFDALDRVVHTSFGDFKAREYLWQINMFRGLRAHDIAKVIGAGVELPADLVQGIWDEISPHAEEWRKMGVFPEAVAVPSDAPLLDRLLGLTGRDPKGP